MWSLILLLPGCLIPFSFKGKDTGPVLSCGADLEEYCEFKFGRACPNIHEVESWTCEGDELVPDSTGAPYDVGDGQPCGSDTTGTQLRCGEGDQLYFGYNLELVIGTTSDGAYCEWGTRIC